ncbi:MAG: universal stress protein [Haloarculaceae archaeon]
MDRSRTHRPHDATGAFRARQQRAVFESEGFAVETHVVRGQPHRRINGIADHVDAGLIVVESRGRSPLENRLIGSTVREGGVVEEILTAEERVSPTVTLLGSRGQSPLRRLLLGSVSESVVARGHGNTLLVPPGSSVPR